MAGMLAKERKDRRTEAELRGGCGFIVQNFWNWQETEKNVVELMRLGRELLTKEDVMDGVADMVHEVQVEATFRTVPSW